MSASRIFLLGSYLIRHRRPSSRVIFFEGKVPASLSFRLCSAADAVHSDARQTSEPTALHPWPEWVAFVDRLKTKGYLIESPEGGSGGVGDADEDTKSIYRDINLVKGACLSFARDRYDIFRSLPSEDIQTVVEVGCPSLFRKVVNSSKRLRAHLLLDEGDVCSTCNLRGSCDRAYVILKDFEAAARTVDLVRILLFYALDPLVLSEGEKPPSKELVDASARKLLTELVNLSEASVEPLLLKPAAKVSVRKESITFLEEKKSQNIEMKKGDWVCTKCNYVNFSKNITCRECGEKPPERFGSSLIEIKKGDWRCSECNFINFSRNVQCLKCKAEGPKEVALSDSGKKKGDWDCPGCSFMNFSSNRKCLRCSEPRPKRQLEPGEWECPSCDFVNFRRNLLCKRCNCNRPERASPVESEEDHIWRSPLLSVNQRS